MKRNLIWGLALVIVPVAIIVGYLGYHYVFVSVQHMPRSASIYALKGLGITISHPPKDFFDHDAQLLVAFGLCLSSICVGAAKIIKALRN